MAAISLHNPFVADVFALPAVFAMVWARLVANLHLVVPRATHVASAAPVLA